MSLTQIWLGLGSNYKQQQHLTSAVAALAEIVQNIDCSTVFESEPVGIQSANFYNFVVTGYTALDMATLSAHLKQIEFDNGRYNKSTKELPLDIDLLLYGELVGVFGKITLPHQGILKNAYVLWPLSLLSPLQKHPVVQKTFAQLWNEAKIEQRLWPLETPWLKSSKNK